MAERRSLSIIVCLYALHCLENEVEGHDSFTPHPIFYEEQCTSILATDLETYQGKLLHLRSMPM